MYKLLHNVNLWLRRAVKFVYDESRSYGTAFYDNGLLVQGMYLTGFGNTWKMCHIIL